MKRFSVAVAATLLAGASPLFAQGAPAPPQAQDISPVSLSLAREIVDRGFPEDTREEIFFATAEQMVIQAREALMKSFDLNEDGALAILDQWIAERLEQDKAVLRRHIPSILEGMARSYAVIFSANELEDILAFVSTPSGQRYFELSSAVLAEPNFAAANQAYMDESLAGLPAAQQDLIARLLEYQASKEEGIEAGPGVS